MWLQESGLYAIFRVGAFFNTSDMKGGKTDLPEGFFKALDQSRFNPGKMLNELKTSAKVEAVISQLDSSGKKMLKCH